MSDTRADFLEVLKEVWEPDIAEFLNNSDPTRKLYESSSRGVVQGKYVKTASHIGRNAGVGFVGELGQTPAPGHESYMNELETLKKFVGRIHFSREVLADSANNTAAVADAMSEGKTGLRNTLMREANFLLHAEGQGVIAQCGTTTAANVIVLDPATPANVMRYLNDIVAAGGADTGLRVDVGIVGNPTSVANTRNVLSVQVDARTITIDGSAITTSGTDFIYRAGQGTIGTQLVTNSLRQIISATAVLHGADPSVYPSWAAQEINAGNAAVAEDIFEEAFDLYDIQTGSEFGDGPNAVILTTHGIRRQLASSMKDRVRYVPTQLKGGFNAELLTLQLGAGPVPLIVDRDTHDNTAYITNTDSVVKIVGEDWHFAEQSGDPIIYDINTDSFHLMMVSRYEYLCRDRRKNLRINNLGPARTGITDPTAD